MTDESDKTREPSAARPDTTERDAGQRVAEFCADLRRMHAQAGKPSLRQMAIKVPYSHTALSNALRGVGGRLPSLELTLALVRACGGDEQAWRARWRREHDRIADHPAARNPKPGTGLTAPSENDVERAPRRLLSRPLLLSVFGIVLALAAGGVVVAVIRSTGGMPSNHGLGGGPTACVQSGSYNSCEIQQLVDQIPSNENPQQMKDHVLRLSKGSPQSPGPWPFVVWDTKITKDDIGILKWVTQADVGTDYGMKVRTTPVEAAQQLGTVSSSSRSVLWVDCYVETDFHPPAPPDDDVGAKWLRVHWPTNEHNDPLAHSLPNDRFIGYVYAGYTLPFTHNGEIPRCP